MSEQKLVSPLLDGFQMGDPISSHDGVRCCPAIKENSDNKYIVKILSIPASQSQLEALLLTGAFQDAAGALNYFKELADGVVREAKLHQQLARLDGFVPCEDFQVVPMDDNQLGYDVYLLTPYRRTLERYLKKNTMTHLEAVNLGLDICAALAACRRAGYIYVDLKPSNIFISDDREYLIGDLGFIAMDSMKYAALPSKYRSSYTAPEMQDVFATISETADIYALGLILYQVYNDGQAPDGDLMPPANADYEMAEIILKACHPDPAQRWSDPTQMGQALVAYMQRNTINDVPIMPPVIAAEEAEAEDPAEAEEPTEENAAEETEATEETAETEEVPAEQAETEETTEEAAEEASEEPAAEETEAAAEETAEEVPEESEEAPAEETEAEADTPAAEETVEEAEADPMTAELEAVYDMISDENIPDAEEVAELESAAVSEDVSDILAQAEELAAHEIPEPVVVPEVKLPEEEEPAEEAPAEEPAAEEAAPAEETEDEDDDGEDEVDIPIAIPDLEPVKKRSKKWLAFLAVIAILAGLAYGAHYYYQNYYLVPVESITLDGTTDQITAQVAVDIDESILTAACTDTYGNTTTSSVVNGQATFTGLNPGTQYTVSLKVDGFYELTGNNSASFTTIRQTNIVSISATTGAEDGSVILSFTVDGTDPENWTVEYAAEGQEAQTMSFTGHMVTIPGLTVGTSYNFRLAPTEDTEIEVVGTDSLDFTASKVILAENVAIASYNEGLMSIRWNAPADTQVEAWTIRCTDEAGYDQTLTVTDCAASFSNVEVDKTYSLEILAQGMTQSVRTDVTPKLLTVTNISCTPVNGSTLRITWEYEGEAPVDGWNVEYTVNGGEVKTMTTDTNAADLSPVIPGVSYSVKVLGVDASYQAPAAGKFSGHGISASNLSYSICLTPSGSGWDYKDVKKYVNHFTAGQSISMVVYSDKKVSADNTNVQVLYVVRDEQGNVLPELAVLQTQNWKKMWKDRYYYPTLPKAPTALGKYTFEVYFDGELALSKPFRIVE